AEFRLANEADVELLMPSLNLLWQASDGKIETVSAAARRGPNAQLTLAQFLGAQAQVEPAAQIARRIDRLVAIHSAGSREMSDSLISAGQIDLGSKLWRSFFGAGDKPFIWNESFETPIRNNFAQFDWNLSQCKYAKIGVTTATARTGQRSLKISYNGIDTT